MSNPSLCEPDDSGRRALIVEDDGAIRLLAARILRRDGFSVDEAVNGREALARLMAGDSFDIVLLDLMMRDMSGVELIAYLREHVPDMLERIVVMTADIRALRGHDLDGIAHVLLKPFDVTALVTAVRDRARHPE